MLSLRGATFACSQYRAFSKSILRLERFSRDSLRSRIYKQEIKDITKQHLQSPGPSNVPYAADVVPLRPARDLWKAFGFTVFVGTASYTIAVISDIEKSRKQITNLYQTTAEYMNLAFSHPSEKFHWDKFSAGERNCLYLVGANLAVFLLWKVKPLQNFMWRYFSNSFASRSLCAPMLLSAFSHSNLIHFGLNMYVVYSFASMAVDKFLDVDQFWAFYCTAAVISSFTSLVHKSAIRSPIRALGASGAILALLTYTCMKIPDARVKILFTPDSFDFSAKSAVVGIILFDLAGLILKFKLFDHAAHLGGSLFGLFYAQGGEQLIWKHFGDYIGAIYEKVRKE